MRRRLNLNTQCQWSLQRPRKSGDEIFYRHDIDLEDDNGLDFGDLIEKVPIVAKRRKCLADFIGGKKPDLVTPILTAVLRLVLLFDCSTTTF